MRKPIPLKERPVDFIYLGFFFVNLLFITYIIDIEQIVIGNTVSFNYPVWPLPFFVDLIHWWGRTFDPLLMARPPFWKATIWVDAVLFGPFYVFAIYAFIKGKDWIRIPVVIFSSVLFTNVFILMSEEIWGVVPALNLPMVLFANAAWFVLPIFLVWKMWKKPYPFSREE
jgi:hypothetical protein